MRALVGFVVCLAVTTAACGSKSERAEPAAASADERYINQDLAPLRAQLEAGLAPIAALQPGDVTQGAALSRRLMTARSFVAGCLVGATKLSPPAAWQATHAELVAIAGELAAAIDDLQMATDAGKPDMFTPAQARLVAQTARYAAWKAALAKALAAAHVTEAPLPPPPAPTTAPPVDNTPHPCGGPCPCTAASIERRGEVIVACMLSRDYTVSNVYCAAGRVTFDPTTGELATCDAAALFSPYPPETPGTPREKVVVCGPGPVTRGATGLTSCILDADVLVGTTTVPRKAKLVFAEGGAIREAVTPDGKATCFAADGSVVACAP